MRRKRKQKSAGYQFRTLISETGTVAGRWLLRLRKILLRTKTMYPHFSAVIADMAKRYFITFSEVSNKTMGDMNSLITSRLVRFFPHVDEEQIASMVSENRKGVLSFLDFISQGFGMFKTKEYSIVERKKLFKRVLVANRGEIALRIIRACRELGIEVVVLYSAEEKESLVVKFADKAVPIGKSKNYLNIKKIVAIAKKVKADAIHPGYGFLAENAEFSKLCKKESIKFIGPTSEMIAALGNKVKAKESMQKAGVPVILGTPTLLSVEQAKQRAGEIGFPVIIKASAGGGGKGMRIIRSEPEIETAFKSAQEEAKRAFGDSSVYLEKYVEDPRHIEFQILADKFGNVIHLGERDCSIQRKHQKLIEEAPSPGLTPELREKIGNAAVEAVKTIRYEGAGTTEFLFDTNGAYYFIEMNTRIQVEHGVTEMVTGVDLVKEQIKLAAGGRLAFKQGDIKMSGWAIECRINAENPFENFMPSTGTIVNYLPPGGPGIRISSSCHVGHKVEPAFDSLLALIICYGKTRTEALQKMNLALNEYFIEGVLTNIPFHKLVINHPTFVEGEVKTSFIEKCRILEMLKKEYKAQKSAILPKDKKVLIVTTAVSQYLAKKRQSTGYTHNGNESPWLTASRTEALTEGAREESM